MAPYKMRSWGSAMPAAATCDVICGNTRAITSLEVITPAFPTSSSIGASRQRRSLRISCAGNSSKPSSDDKLVRSRSPPPAGR